MNYQKTTNAAEHKSTTPIKSTVEIYGKDKDFSGQYKSVYDSFSEFPKTMMMVSVETNIMRSNICRYVACLKKSGQIHLIETNTCPITKCKAGFYKTDPAIIPEPYIAHPVVEAYQDVNTKNVPSGSAFDELRKTGDYCYQLFY